MHAHNKHAHCTCLKCRKKNPFFFFKSTFKASNRKRQRRRSRSISARARDDSTSCRRRFVTSSAISVTAIGKSLRECIKEQSCPNGSCKKVGRVRRRADRASPRAAVTDMHAHNVFGLLCCLLLPRALHSAPAAAWPPLRDAVDRARMLVDKIAKDMPAVHGSVVSTEASSWQMMAASLGIPPAPVLKPLSEGFTPETSVSRMEAGGRLYQGLLGVLSGRLGRLDHLLADLRDLLTQIAKMREAAQLSVADVDQNQDTDLASHLHGDYEVQVAAHLTLCQLRSFCHDMIRGLRALATLRHPLNVEHLPGDEDF
ncbi:uncharacterized protein LOC133556145 isoform X2 [Nerophis ophidion]|uniref:uncharacterized protein LOC133556145 isoform X2 n=1 Tax=Nerophis ophidion TaxID=159077 RepID=UPI002AE09EEE|nr:uncharacterized protein LOC133556145 isoform X2 [Nerophis ophidion]